MVDSMNGPGNWTQDDYASNETLNNNEYIFDRISVRVTILIFYTIVFGFCFLGNLMVILVVTLHWRMRSITNFCLANLAFADLCVGIFCVYQNIISYLMDSWVFGEFMCKMYHFINSLSTTASVLILVVICIERYLAIIHPMTCKQMLTINRLRLTIVFVWILSALLSSPRFYYFSTISIPLPDGEMEILCVPNRLKYNSKFMDMTSMTLLFLVPLSVISILYTHIGVVLWKSSRTKMNNISSSASASATLSVGSSSNSTEAYYNGEAKNKNCVETVNLTLLPAPAATTTYGDLNSYSPRSRFSSAEIKENPSEIEAAGKQTSTQETFQIPSRNKILHPISNFSSCDSCFCSIKRESGQSESLSVPHSPMQQNCDENCSCLDDFVADNSDPIVLVHFVEVKQKPGSKIIRRNLSRESCRFVVNSRCRASKSVATCSYQHNNHNRIFRGQPLDSSKCKKPLTHFEVSTSAPQIPGRVRRMRVVRSGRYGSSALQSRRRIIRMLVVVVLAFAICHMPFHARKVWQYWSPSWAPYQAGGVFSTLFTALTFLVIYANSAINPILYAFMSKKFRLCCRDLLCCRMRQTLRISRNASVKSNHAVAV